MASVRARVVGEDPSPRLAGEQRRLLVAREHGEVLEVKRVERRRAGEDRPTELLPDAPRGERAGGRANEGAQRRRHHAFVARAGRHLQDRRPVAVVAGERLVAPLPREHHLHPLGRQPRHEVERDARRVGDGFVLVPHERRERREELVGGDGDLVVVRPVPLGDQARVAQLVGLALGERDREGLDLIVDELAHRGRDRRRVDSAGEEHAERHVGHEAHAHRLAEALLVVGHEVALGSPVGALAGERQVPILAERNLPVAPGERVARGQAPHASEERLVARGRVVGEEVRERPPVERGLHRPDLDERLDLAREVERPVVGVDVVQRLDAEAVAEQYELPRAPVPNGHGEHPSQPLRGALAVALEQVQHGLRVAMRGVPHALGRERPHLLRVVVDLAVVDELQRAVGARHGLRAVGEVDDAQPAVPEGHARAVVGPLDESARAVGAAMGEHVAHARERRVVHRVPRARRHYVATDPAHIGQPASALRPVCRPRARAPGRRSSQDTPTGWPEVRVATTAVAAPSRRTRHAWRRGCGADATVWRKRHTVTPGFRCCTRGMGENHAAARGFLYRQNA